MKCCWNSVPIGILVLAGACSGPETNKADAFISSVKERYAPDKRTALFDISAGKQGNMLVLNGETNIPAAKTALFSLLDSAGVEAVDSVRLLPAEDLDGEVFGLAMLSVCNLRVEPGHSEEMATQILLGTPVRILKKDRGWLLVQTPENYIAWTEKSGITSMDSAAFAAWQNRLRLIYTADYGQAYAGPGGKEIVSDLVAGDILVADGEAGEFYRAVFPDGRKAYVKKKEASLLGSWISSLNPNGENVLKAARQMMGAPYLWGGTSTKGVDCSGFTKTAYFMNGIILPRDASQQVLAGEAVDIYQADTVSIASCLKNLRKGDLIFFTNDPDKRSDAHPRITHVGIYIGQGEFIHSSGFVHVSSLADTAGNYSGNRAKTLVSARRILTAAGREGVGFIETHPLYHSILRHGATD